MGSGSGASITGGSSLTADSLPPSEQGQDLQSAEKAGDKGEEAGNADKAGGEAEQDTMCQGEGGKQEWPL
eukprot:9531365-Alexandrium_andersonii.AAC.1